MSDMSWCLMWCRASVRSCHIIPGLLPPPSKFDNIAIFHCLQSLKNCKFAIPPGPVAMETPQMPGWRLRRMYVCRQWMFGDEAALRHHRILLT